MNNLLLFAESTIGRDIDWAGFGIAMAIIAGVALLLGVLIVVLGRVCEVKEDPRIGEITELLAGSNCGACGHPGCAGFAKALVDGVGSVSDCGQTSKVNAIEISNILGVSVDANAEPTIAVVACAGGNKCKDKYDYQGYGDCTAQNMLAGGSKACHAGCMGTGTCSIKCPYDAITVKDGVAVVDPDLCRSCGLCIKACPKGIIKRIPVSAQVYVACSNHDRGKDVTSKCSVGCIACGLCVRNCPSDAIHIIDNVAVIDYSKCTHCKTCVAKCPRKIILEVHPTK